MKKKLIGTSFLLLLAMGGFAQQAVTSGKTPVTVAADSTAAQTSQQLITSGKDATALPERPGDRPVLLEPPQQAPVSQKKKPE